MSVKSAARQSGGPSDGATTKVAAYLSVEHAILVLLPLRLPGRHAFFEATARAPERESRLTTVQDVDADRHCVLLGHGRGFSRLVVASAGLDAGDTSRQSGSAR